MCLWVSMSFQLLFLYLYLQGQKGIIQGQNERLVPDWIEIFVDGFAFEDLFPLPIELDVRIWSAPWITSHQFAAITKANMEMVQGVTFELFSRCRGQGRGQCSLCYRTLQWGCIWGQWFLKKTIDIRQNQIVSCSSHYFKISKPS